MFIFTYYAILQCSNFSRYLYLSSHVCLINLHFKKISKWLTTDCKSLLVKMYVTERLICSNRTVNYPVILFDVLLEYIDLFL